MPPRAVIEKGQVLIEFQCPGCGRPRFARLGDGGGEYDCADCRRPQPIPALPCASTPGCAGVYAVCRGKLLKTMSGGSVVEGPEWETRCDRCDDLLPYWTKEQHCTRVLCSRCLQPYPI